MLRRIRLAVADTGVALAADPAILDRDFLDRQREPFGGALDQKWPLLRRCLAQRHGRDPDGFAGDGRSLVGAREVAENHADAVEGHVEFFGNDLPQRGANAGSQIDVAVDRP